MTSQTASPNLSQSFALAGPSHRKHDACLPVRGDLAHIRLAGTVFVPHYAVPMPHRLTADAGLLGAARSDAEVLAQVAATSLFDVLDIAGEWAWGVVDGDGLVGYLPLGLLEAI